MENWGKVNLFTRPRRFGKTLNMSMMKYFFEVGCDSTLFDGLDISEEKALCDEYMGKFPVISISLKGLGGINFDEAKGMFRGIIGNEAKRFQFLMQDDTLSDMDRQQYKKIIELNDKGEFAMSDGLLRNSLFILSQLLKKYYGKNTIILIDEYDVPLDKAYQAGYYDEMTELIRSMFGQALKTNDSLYFAVLTGCLRISKESIFTGFNNFNVVSVRDIYFNDYFGFTDEEVRKMLEYYDRMDKYDTIKEWYDGYQFGNLEIYCPWDVISYCYALKMNPLAKPQNYWVNTSSNDIIKIFVSMAKSATRDEIEVLISGGSIKKKIRQELTYRDLDSHIDNLWSILFTTGYLTQCGEDEADLTKLVIPNKEICGIFVEQLQEWFREETEKDAGKLQSFCRAFKDNDISAIEEGFNAYLRKTISIRDTNVRKDMKENFYHGILLGLFGYMDGWRKALQQIKDRNYEEILIDDGMKTIYKYGIACYKKRCKVLSE